MLGVQGGIAKICLDLLPDVNPMPGSCGGRLPFRPTSASGMNRVAC